MSTGRHKLIELWPRDVAAKAKTATPPIRRPNHLAPSAPEATLLEQPAAVAAAATTLTGSLLFKVPEDNGLGRRGFVLFVCRSAHPTSRVFGSGQRVARLCVCNIITAEPFSARLLAGNISNPAGGLDIGQSPC